MKTIIIILCAFCGLGLQAQTSTRTLGVGSCEDSVTVTVSPTTIDFTFTDNTTYPAHQFYVADPVTGEFGQYQSYNGSLASSSGTMLLSYGSNNVSFSKPTGQYLTFNNAAFGWVFGIHPDTLCPTYNKFWKPRFYSLP